MTQMSEEDRIELMIVRQVSPRLAAIEAAIKVFTETMSQVSTRYSEEKAENRACHNELKEEVSEIKAILNGNGKDGLVATVNKLVSWVDDQKKLQWTVISAIIIELVGLLFLGVAVLLKYTP